MSLEAHSPTGFIYYAKMTQNINLFFIVSSLHSHRFAHQLKRKWDVIYPNILRLSSINFNYVRPRVNETQDKEWSERVIYYFSHLDAPHHQAPHKNPPENNPSRFIFNEAGLEIMRNRGIEPPTNRVRGSAPNLFRSKLAILFSSVCYSCSNPLHFYKFFKRSVVYLKNGLSLS